jgi:hypothetical protein
MKSLLLVEGIILCRLQNYHDSRAPGQEQSMILPRLVGIGFGIFIGLVLGSWSVSVVV